MEKELLFKFIEGRTDPQEEETVVRWLQADPANQQELNRLWFVRNAVVANAPRQKSSRIPFTRQSRIRRTLFRRWIAAAAALALVAGSWYASRSVTNLRASKQYVAVAAPAGQRIDLTLQDGTKVCLNSGAQLEYPIRFGRNRRVRLSGEAMFDVRHDAAHPFVVETFACDIEVLGTRFNVATDARNRTFSTALLRGRLQVTNRFARNDRIIMETNDLVRLESGRLLLTTIENKDDYLWPEGIVSLVGHSFPELIARFEKLYGVKIIFAGDTIPHLDVVYGKIPISMGLDYALRALQKITPFEYERTDTHTIVIR